MKLNCKVIEDLLPLYLDHVCSDESRKLVEEHLQECEKCRALLENTDAIQIVPIEEGEAEKNEIVKKAFQKIHRRWMVSLAAVLMLIPLALIGILGYGEICGSGIAFSNLDDIYRCYRYLNFIRTGQYDRAVQIVDFSKNDYLLVDCVSHMSLDEYQEYMSKRFLTKLEEYSGLGISITNIRFDDAYRRDDGGWCIRMAFYEIYPDGSGQTIIAHMNGETMYGAAYSYPDRNKTERDGYLDTILSLSSVDESLRYKDYAVTFELKAGEKAIIRRDKKSDAADGNIVYNITYGTGTCMRDEPDYQDVFETSVPGKYSVIMDNPDGTIRYLTLDEIDIEIVPYAKSGEP